MKTARIEVVAGKKAGLAFWRVVAANGEILAHSEDYAGGIPAAKKGARALVAAVASMAAAQIVVVP